MCDCEAMNNVLGIMAIMMVLMAMFGILMWIDDSGGKKK